MTRWRSASFDIDGQYAVVGWTDGQTWNGWEVPRVELQALLGWIEQWNREQDEQIGVVGGRVLWDGREIPSETITDTLGVDHEVYPIGEGLRWSRIRYVRIGTRVERLTGHPAVQKRSGK